MRKVKTLLIAALFIVLGSSVFAEEAIVTYVSGKVEVQRNGQWVALQKGDKVAKAETISTGFQSEAKIKILESVMYLGPVTRITLEELSSSSQKDNVNVYLKTGTARSQVKHVDNKRVNYQVHTAVAVASCRGTEWIINDSNKVDCIEGVVAVAAYKAPAASTSTNTDEKEGESETDEGDTPTSEEGVLVKADQSVTVSDTNTVSAPVNTVVQTAAEVTSTAVTAGSQEGEGGASGGADAVAGAGAGDAAGASGGTGAGGVPAGFGTVIVSVDFEEQ